MMINYLDFQPLPGFFSCHLQTILGSYRLSGKPPPSEQKLIVLEDDDLLSCEVSTPLTWKNKDKIIILVHGLGGNHNSNYMVRLSRKFYENGCKTIRINMRGAGSGAGLSKLPYHGGCSYDILKAIHSFKQENPFSDIILIGFSLGGSVVLKLAGELGHSASNLLKMIISVCPPVCFFQTVQNIEMAKNYFYHKYYLKRVLEQASPWIKANLNITSLYQFDDLIMAPLYGFKGADEYYSKCSSLQFLPNIRHETHVIFAEDDPFIPLDMLKKIKKNEFVRIWMTKYGGHMGFLGHTKKEYNSFWLDQLLLNWVKP